MGCAQRLTLLAFKPLKTYQSSSLMDAFESLITFPLFHLNQFQLRSQLYLHSILKYIASLNMKATGCPKVLVTIEIVQKWYLRNSLEYHIKKVFRRYDRYGELCFLPGESLSLITNFLGCCKRKKFFKRPDMRFWHASSPSRC